MKCQVCKINPAEHNSIVCSGDCDEIRLKIIGMLTKYTPTNGCVNCRGDLHIKCTAECKAEFFRANALCNELYALARFEIKKVK